MGYRNLHAGAHSRIGRCGAPAWLPTALCLLFTGSSLGRAVLPLTQPPDNSDSPTHEVWRLRIANTVDGPIDASCDRGAHWTLIGRVTAPATQSLTGYLAAGYAPVGTVAATAVHGIRVRLGGKSLAYPSLINLVPSQFAQIPHFFGGQISGASGIYTNIPAGVGLFRDLSPYVGSPCYLADKSGDLHELTTSYVPHVGDILEILSRERLNALRSVVFENRVGGAVTATYADGSSQQITTVGKPVAGVGRFDGTSYTGVGAVNTNHTCVITISTAPVSSSTQLEGSGPERRGGFQIEPSYHNSQTEEAGAPQVMILGALKAQRPSLEGRAPLFSGAINLEWNPDDPAHSWICDVQTAATGDEWLPMPQIIGDDPNALAKRGITAFRLHRDDSDDSAAWLTADIARIAAKYQDQQFAAAKAGAIPLVVGRFVASAPASDNAGSEIAEFTIDGSVAAITSAPPFLFDWDSRSVANGEHVIEADIENNAGKVLKTTRKLVYVENPKTPG